MKYFKDSDGAIRAIEADQEFLVGDDWQPLTEMQLTQALEPSPQQKVDRYRVAVGLHIDNKAKALGFDSIITAVTYADEPADALNQKYGAALREWRSECWQKCREVLATWQGGGEEPTLEDLIDSLPAFEVA